MTDEPAPESGADQEHSREPNLYEEFIKALLMDLKKERGNNG